MIAGFFLGIAFVGGVVWAIGAVPLFLMMLGSGSRMGLRDIGVVVGWPIWMGYDYLKNKLFR